MSVFRFAHSRLPVFIENPGCDSKAADQVYLDVVHIDINSAQFVVVV